MTWSMSFSGPSANVKIHRFVTGNLVENNLGSTDTGHDTTQDTRKRQILKIEGHGHGIYICVCQDLQ